MNKICIRGFPGGPVVKNLSANAGGTDRFNTWPRKIPHTSEQLSPFPTTKRVAPTHNNWRNTPFSEKDPAKPKINKTLKLHQSCNKTLI